MDTDRTPIPGTGVLHHFRTGGGIDFALLTEAAGRRRLLAYAPGSDEPSIDIALEPDEADQVAELMHTGHLAERLTRLEQRVERLAGQRAEP
ncbi:hypothetical protein [Nocardia caishijiensis]|uniref:Potassium/proton antiporter subunit KhtT-like N-terminal domain-containing protein n=1 Tax=Nocardia caishijiensis TaxID=184756 RepID=A0ABQ6YNG2_9NOCA|nr:hypothetical protein [Nocardia caishijiensis]KAF0847251.1 hypothetical protein FNL39_103148 [Nocardia caishijiensis]